MFRLLLFAIFAYFFYLFFWETDYKGFKEGFEEGYSVRILTGEETRKIICAKRGTFEVQRTVGEQPAVAPRVSTHILSGADISSGTLDNYYDSFSVLDLRARGVSSLNEYLRRIESVCYDCDADKESIIRRCVEKVDWDLIGSPIWIDMARLRALPWTIAVTKGDGSAYEYGLPHTRGDVIVISESDVADTDEFVDTLMHEQLHVYQKMYPEDFQKYLDYEGFVRYCSRKTNVIQNVAANPDADEWIYIKDKGDVFVGQYTGGGDDYKSVTFKPINHPRYDCPQEYAVYTLLRKPRY